jgi:hypothetical protein
MDFEQEIAEITEIRTDSKLKGAVAETFDVPSERRCVAAVIPWAA